MLGLWIQRSEGAKFWHQILSELQNRGMKDILVVCADGLTGFPDAEAINRQICKVIKTKGHFPTDESVTNVLYLALTNASKKWTLSPECTLSAIDPPGSRGSSSALPQSSRPRTRRVRAA